MNFEKVTYFELAGNKGYVIDDGKQYLLDKNSYCRLLKDLVACGLSKKFKNEIRVEENNKSVWIKIED